MKNCMRNVLGFIAIKVLIYSPNVEGVRPTTSLTSLQNSDQTMRALLLSTRGGSIGIGRDSVSVIADVILPRAISGGQVKTVAAEEQVTKPSKWIDLTTRVLSAVGMVGFLAGLSYYFKEDGLSALVVLLQAMMYGEMTRTIGGDDWGSIGATIRKYWWFVTAVIVWNVPKIFPWNRVELEATAFAMTMAAGVVGSILSFQHHKSGTVEFREFVRQTAVSLLSATLVILPSSYWIGTLEEHGMTWIFVPAALIAINDIMAYVFGRLVGKHPLLPAISPKKTWEGFLGAAVSTVGAAWLTLAEDGGTAQIGPGLKSVSRTDGMVLAVMASTIAPFAGFLASVIKRAYGRKDFGDTFPGHGGFVDRLDCQLVIAPFVYFYLSLSKVTEA